MKVNSKSMYIAAPCSCISNAPAVFIVSKPGRSVCPSVCQNDREREREREGERRERENGKEVMIWIHGSDRDMIHTQRGSELLTLDL